jgi:peptide/nickel transport system substrate-binding protein
VGIDVTLESTDAGGWVRRLTNWEYELTVNFVYQYGDPSLGVARTYISSNIQKIPVTNTSGYSNPEVERLFDAAQTEPEPAKRAELFKQVQAKLIADMPLIWTIELLFPTVHDRRLRNVIQLGTGVHACFDDVFFAA